VHPETAAAAKGIPAPRFCEWMRQGKSGQEPYKTFRDAVTRARAEAEHACVIQLVQTAMGGAVVSRTTETVQRKDGSTHTTTRETYARPDAAAAMFLLERSFSEHWGRRTMQIDMPVPEGDEMQGVIVIGNSRKEYISGLRQVYDQVMERRGQKQLTGPLGSHGSRWRTGALRSLRHDLYVS
jgi:hypothetical protein